MKRITTGIFSGLFVLISCLFNNTVSSMEAAGVDIHGFVSQGFIKSDEYHYLSDDSKKGSFEYNELGVNFGKDLTEQLRVGIQFFSRDLGNVADNKITVDWAYGDYRVKDWFGIRAGRLKLPLALYNETRDVDLLRTSIVLPQSVYSDLLRDTVIAANGAGLYGNIDMSAGGSLDYQAIVGQMNIDNDSGFKKYFDSRFNNTNPALDLTLNGDSDTDLAYVGSLRWNTPLDGLILGVSGMTMKADNPILIAGAVSATQNTDNTLLAYGAEYTIGDLVMAAEYQSFEVESNISGSISEITSEGYYVSASYRFTDLFTLGTYYSWFYPDQDDKDGNLQTVKSDAWEKDLAVTLRFDISDNIVLKLEGHSVDGTARVDRNDNLDRTEDDFSYYVAKVTFSF